MMFTLFIIGLVVGILLEPRVKPSHNTSIKLLEEQDDELETLANIITTSDGDISDSLASSFLELGSVQEIQTIKDYLEQLKADIRTGASSYVQDSVAMMEELTTAIKDLKAKIEATVDRVNTKSEQKLLAIKAIEELIGYGGNTNKEFVQLPAKDVTTLVNAGNEKNLAETHVTGG